MLALFQCSALLCLVALVTVALVTVAAMDWDPSDKMTVDDLKAVLMSWGVEIPKKPNKEMLQKLVSKEYKQIMKRLYGHMRPTGSIASSSCTASDKAVGTDLPSLLMSFIGSEGGDSDIVQNGNVIETIVNELNEMTFGAHDLAETQTAAACAAEVEATQTASACAAEEVFVPSLRRALEMEIEATAKARAKAKAKDKKKGTANKNALD